MMKPFKKLNAWYKQTTKQSLTDGRLLSNRAVTRTSLLAACSSQSRLVVSFVLYSTVAVVVVYSYNLM